MPVIKASTEAIETAIPTIAPVVKGSTPPAVGGVNLCAEYLLWLFSDTLQMNCQLLTIVLQNLSVFPY